MSKISEITPIKDGMTKVDAEKATKLILKEILVSENMLEVKDIVSNETKMCGVRGFQLITLKDGSEWVVGDRGIERLIGAQYLKKNLAVEGWDVVKTKFIYKPNSDNVIKVELMNANEKPLENLLTLCSSDFISLSKYVGDKKPTPQNSKLIRKTKVVDETGFNDMVLNANLREQENGDIVIIDTEYCSFTSAGVFPISDATNLELSGVEFSFPISEFFG
jgi:hypothetical protein